MKIAFVLSTAALVPASVNGFGVINPSLRLHPRTPTTATMMKKLESKQDYSFFDPLDLASTPATTGGDRKRDSWMSPAAVAAVVMTTTASTPVWAAGPDWGVFEGRSLSLLHPLMMGGMFLFSLSTGFLGLQWRRLRTMGQEITDLKKTLPDLGGAANVAEALAAAKAADTVDSALVSKLTAALPTEEQIAQLTADRKELTSQNLRDRHFSQGALLAFIGTLFAIEGPLNTYARAGKLFPGPHLYAGAGLVVLWAAAAATVPSMQKGNDTARTIHIAANVAGLGLFAWQIQSGIPILLKVIEKTSWP